MKLNKSTKNLEAFIEITVLFLAMNILGMIPDWIMPGEPQTDAEYDAKIRLVYLFFTIKFTAPYLVLGYSWLRKKLVYTDVIDWGYMGLFLATCIKDTRDVFIAPFASTASDWGWLIPIWLLLTSVKMMPYIKPFIRKRTNF